MAELIRSSKALSVHSQGTTKYNGQNKATKTNNGGLSADSTMENPRGKAIQTPELDAAVGNTPDFVAPSRSGSGSSETPDGFGDRLGHTLLGAGQQFLSSFAEVGRALNDMVTDGNNPLQKAQEAMFAPYVDKSKSVSDDVGDFLLGYADKQAAKSAENIATAKHGLGTVGQFLVDAGVAGTQMAADVGIAAMTGGAAVVPMMVRSFGAGAQEARNKGYSLDQQLALGLGNAATEWATEKLFGGNPLYDKANSGVINKVIAKVTQNEDILKFLSSRPVETLNEGLEEVVSGVINPAIELAVTGNADWPTVEELIREGAIGVALGSAGQVVHSVMSGKKDSDDSPLLVQSQDSKTDTGKSTTAEDLADILMGDGAKSPQQSAGNTRLANEDLADYMKVGERGHVRNEKERIIQRGESPILTTVEEIKRFINDSVLGRIRDTIKGYGRVGNKMAADITAADPNKTLDVSGYYLELDANHMAHASDHILDEDPRNVPLTPEEFERIPEFIDNYTDILGVTRKKDGSIRIKIGTKVNGYSVVIETVSKGRKSLHPRTAWKMATEVYEEKYYGQKGQKKVDTSANPEGPSAISGQDTGASTIKVSQSSPAVNSAQYHPINPQGAANAQANYGRDPVQVPVRNFEGHLTSKTGSTILNSGITANGVAKSISDLFASGGLSRVRFTDAEAVVRAQRTISDMGFAKAVEKFKAEVAAGKRGKDLMALGIELFNNASTNAKTEADFLAAADIAVELVEAAREQAQAIQVLNLFNKATPEGRFYFAVKGVDNLISRMEQKYGARAAGVEVSQDLLSDYYEAVKSGNEQAIKETWQEVQKDIAAQIPPNWKDRLNAWRYLAMLGNPKTHIRNVAGNALFMPFRMMKNTIGAGLESAYGTKQRTKAVLDRTSANDRALLQMSMQDYEAAIDSQMSSKYDESGNEIDRQRQILPGVLDTASKKNTELLQKEDRWFSRPAYAQSMAGWLKANNITPQQFAAMLADKTPGVRKTENLRPLKAGETVKATDRDNYGKVMQDNGDGTYMVHFVAENGSEADVKLDRTALIPTRGKNSDSSFDISEASPAEILAEARAYAMLEAKKATYQDSNAFSDKIASFGKGDGIWSTAVSAVLPFKRTPANIIARGVEYSPAYLIKGIHEMRNGVKSGKVSAAEAIDHMASGLTGTAIMALGAMLSHFDILRASGDDDEKQAAFDKLQGKQNYALSFGDKSFTIDWLAPEALPLFVGAELYELWAGRQEGDTATAQDFLESILSITDPILETSMLSSINDLIDSVGYSDAGVLSILSSVATNYLSSFVPTIGGQIERSFEKGRQETYRYNDSGLLNASGQYDVANLLNKVPGFDYGQIDYVDAWGRTQDYGNPLFNALNQFANPAYVSDARVTEVDDELQKLYDAGQTTVLPQRRSQSDTIAVRDADGNIIEERHLTAEEYEQYNRTKGQTSLELVSQLMDSGLYASMNDDEKAKAIENIYSYATAVANLEAEPTTKVDSWVKKAKESSDPGKYIQLYSAAQNLEPYGDNKSVSTWQKIELVSKNTNTKQADEFIPLYMEGNNPTKYEMARERGYSPERFVEAYTAMNTIESDRDENGESLGNVRKKVIAHLVSQGWPEANAAEMYKLFRADSGDIKNWTW